MTLAGSHRHHPSASPIAPVVEFAGARDPLSGVLLLLYVTDGPSDVPQDWDDDRDSGSK